MKKISLFVIIVLILASCQNVTEQPGYEVNGVIKGVADSTMIFFVCNDAYQDTALVINEKFRFSGTVDAPANIYLMVQNSRDYLSFWIENSVISISGEIGTFNKSTIIGSETQKYADIWYSRVLPMRKKVDSLMPYLRNRNLDKAVYDSIMKVRDEIDLEEEKVTQDFVREFNASIVSLDMLNGYKKSWGKELTTELYSSFNEELKNSDTGMKIARYLELNKNPQAGDMYIDFEMENIDGENIKLSDIEGKVILVEFWASWCYPCKVSNPELVSIYNDYKGKGFAILSVSIDKNKEQWIKAVENSGLIWENVCDFKGNENEASLIYGVNSVPYGFLINEDGKIIDRQIYIKDLRKRLEELL